MTGTIADIIRDISELDYDTPIGQGHILQCSADELRIILERRLSGGAPGDPLDYKLPCEVRLPPATTFGVGVSLRTVVHALQRRTDQYPPKFANSPDLSGVTSPFQRPGRIGDAAQTPDSHSCCYQGPCEYKHRRPAEPRCSECGEIALYPHTCPAGTESATERSARRDVETGREMAGSENGHSSGEPSGKPDVARALRYLDEARDAICFNDASKLSGALDEVELSLRANSPGEPSGLHVPASLIQRTVEFLGTWRDAGPECECEPPGHSCGWPKLRNLTDDWRTLTKEVAQGEKGDKHGG